MCYSKWPSNLMHILYLILMNEHYVKSHIWNYVSTVHNILTAFFSQGINEEQSLLSWETTKFPLLQAMVTLKEPYDQLWHTTYDFHQKYERWYNGKWDWMDKENVGLVWCILTYMITEGCVAQLLTVIARPYRGEMWISWDWKGKERKCVAHFIKNFCPSVW